MNASLRQVKINKKPLAKLGSADAQAIHPMFYSFVNEN